MSCFAKVFGICLAVVAIFSFVAVPTHAQLPATQIKPDIVFTPFLPFSVLQTTSGLLCGDNEGGIWRLERNGWSLLFNASIKGPVQGLFEDKVGSIYASVSGSGTLDRFNGTLRSFYTGLVEAQSGCFWHMWDLQNGTILGAYYPENAPLLFRSDDQGLSWNMWYNFSKVFPEYAVSGYTNRSWYDQRHLHGVWSLDGRIYVSIGDLAESTYSYENGTWVLVNFDGFTAAYAVPGLQRILLGPDSLGGMVFLENGTFKNAASPCYSPELAPFVFSIDGDRSNGVIYAGATYGASPEPPSGVMVSLDDGESWHAIFRFPTDIVRTVKVAVFNGTLYFVAPEENRLYCFQSLDKVGWANLLYRGSSLFVYPNASGYLNLEIGDYKVKVYSLTPELLNDNPSLEYWDQTVPRDYGLKQNFNGTLKISKNEPLDGNNAFTLQLNGTGELTLYYPNQGNPLIPIKPGQIVTVSFWIKSNITSSGDFGQRLLTYNALFNENQTLNGFLPWKQQPFTAGQHNRYSQFVSSFTVPLNCYHMRVFFGVIFFSPLPAMVSIDCVYVIQNSPSSISGKSVFIPNTGHILYMNGTEIANGSNIHTNGIIKVKTDFPALVFLEKSDLTVPEISEPSIFVFSAIVATSVLVLAKACARKLWKRSKSEF